MTSWQYQLAADAILILHFGFVVFVVGGLLMIFIGHRLGWRWIYGIRFRLLHLAAIGVVVLQSWLGALCPLTVWEMQLRELAGDLTYQGGCIDCCSSRRRQPFLLSSIRFSERWSSPAGSGFGRGADPLASSPTCILQAGEWF